MLLYIRLIKIHEKLLNINSYIDIFYLNTTMLIYIYIYIYNCIVES